MPIIDATMMSLMIASTHPEITDQEKIDAIRRNWKSFYYIHHPTEEMETAAVEQFGLAIREIIDPSEAVQFAAIHQNISAYYAIRNPSQAATELFEKYRMFDSLTKGL